jgi:hypothetical protein
VTFSARLYEDHGPAEPEDELLPSDREAISSDGERPGELLELSAAGRTLVALTSTRTTGQPASYHARRRGRLEGRNRSSCAARTAPSLDSPQPNVYQCLVAPEGPKVVPSF